ncbi:MAG TPA: DUF882 domain-containing protein [Saprospiraceae bacterium]|nr:DUF882 domain-containing protein [Saprospiraceae bacterium]
MKRRTKNNLKTFAVLVVLFVLFIKTNWRVQDRLYEILYDLRHSNHPPYSKKEITDVLSSIPTMSYDQLDGEYLEYTKSAKPKYKPLLKDLTYYRVKRSDLNKRVVGPFRLKQFMCNDEYYTDCILGKEEFVPCPINPELFFKTLDLLDKLNQLGYNEDGFVIVNGHRHPAYNEKIGGAKLSRHIKGEAVDISVYDIDGDSYSDQRDKQIILDILDKYIIKDKGGIGLYPGTHNVHYDVRGTKARWNSF